MRVVKLKGGLGNQMFQYAYAKLIEQRTGETVKLDFSSFSSLKNDAIRVPRIERFILSLEAATKRDVAALCLFPHVGKSQSFFYRCGIMLEKTFNTKYFFEPNRAYIDPNELLKYTYYDGYWQSYRYVDEVADKLRMDFVPRAPLAEQSQETQREMMGQNSVFIGVRRGDYAAEASHYGVFSNNYYRTAMDLIERRVDSPVFYVFSNDIEWCKKNMDWGSHKVLFRDNEKQMDDFDELILMSSCKHAIVVNSTYNWWGAYLISNPDKIIVCPSKWFFDDKPIDIIPPQWTKIKEL